MPFTEEWILSGHSTIKAWLVACCKDGWPSGRFSHLHRGPLELCQSDHGVLGHLPSRFGQAASSRKCLGDSKTSSIEEWWKPLCSWDPSPDLCLDTIISRSSTDNSLDFMTWFLLWHALSTVGHYIDRCVPFQIMSNQLNLPQVDSNQVVETSQGWSMETGCTWAQFQVT